MKKSLLLMVSVLAGCAMASVPTGKTFPVYTTGPDLYADGTTVLDGERYALVWVAEGATFGGFNSDFSLADTVNNKIVTTSLFAKNGKLDEVGIVIPDAFVPDSGSFHLFVLDTRAQAAGIAAGSMLNSYGLAKVQANTGSAENCMGATVASLVGSSVTTDAALSSATPAPSIKSIEVKNGKVYVTVEKTSAAAFYNIKGATKVEAGFALTPETAPQVGGAETVTFEYPVASGAQFFQVVGAAQSAKVQAK